MMRLRIRASKFRSPILQENTVKMTVVGFQDTTGAVAFVGGATGNADLDLHGRQDTAGSLQWLVLQPGMQDTSGRVSFKVLYYGLQDTAGFVTFAGQTLYAYYRTVVLAPQPDLVAETLTEFPAENLISGAWLKTTGNGGQVRSATADDVRFQTETGADLDHEKLGYDGAAGVLRYALRVPSWLTTQQYRHIVRYGADI